MAAVGSCAIAIVITVAAKLLPVPSAPVFIPTLLSGRLGWEGWKIGHYRLHIRREKQTFHVATSSEETKQSIEPGSSALLRGD